MMNQDITLKEILQIEDCPELLNIQCPRTGIPLWTIARIPFLRFIIGDLLYGIPFVNTGGVFSGRSRFRYAINIARAFVHNASFNWGVNKEYPIMLMATGARVFKSEKAYFNQLSDPFVSLAPDKTLVIEDLFGLKWPFPRHHDRLLFHTPLRVEGVIRSRFAATGYDELARILVELISQRANDCIGWECGSRRKFWLQQFCANGAASLLPRYKKYKSIYQKYGTRLLIKEEACYGGADNAAAIFAAKNMGIVTAEYQHGAISSGHDAYNFSQTVSESYAYLQTLPDYFLTYGSWWANQINAPVKKVVIGNPRRMGNFNAKPELTSGARVALILGDGIETSMYIDFCKRLIVALAGEVEVVFRPHPLERAAVEAMFPNNHSNALRIDLNHDIYRSFKDVSAVVGEISTGLFEAIGFVSYVYIWNTFKSRFGYPLHPFRTFSNAEELAQLLTDECTGQVDTEKIDSIWAPDWRQSYIAFIEEAVAL
jgi:hypothetical protein